MGAMLKSVAVLTMVLFLIPVGGYAEPDQKAVFDRGVKEFKEGRFQEAVNFFSELIAIAPDDAKAYKNRGVALMNLGEIDWAIADFNKAISINPELSGIHSNLGAAWHYKGAYDKAIASYDTDISQRPDLYITYFNRALSKADLNQLEMALIDIEKALELKPDFDAALSAKKDFQEKLSKGTAHKWAVQMGAFLVEKNAVEMRGELSEKGYDVEIVIQSDSKQRTWYLVRFARDLDRENAEKICRELKARENMIGVVRPAGKL